MFKVLQGGVLALVIAAWAATMVRAEPVAAARQGDVVTFCQAHPTADFPGRLFLGPSYKPGDVPEQLAKLDGLVQWRCRDGQVWVCGDSADGDWCSKKNPSRRPSSFLGQACRDDPDAASLDFAVEHYSAFDWRCKGGVPVIIRGYPLDRRGFFKASWAKLVMRHGVVTGPSELPEGPR